MAMFGVQGRDSYDALYGVLNQPADTTALEREATPGMFAGDMTGAVATGVYRGLSRGASVLGNVATPVLSPIAKSIDEIFGSDTNTWLRGEQEKANRALFESKLDPKTSGMAAQVLYGLGDVLTTVLTVGGRPYAAGALYGITQAGIGMSEGLDPTTALAKGAIEGGAMGVSVALPAALTGNLAFRAASGGLLNVGVGIPERTAVSSLLNARGYPEMAKQYAPLDSASIITELVLGAAFGGLLGPRAKVKLPAAEEVPPSAIDAALTANQATHAEIHTAPGVPADTRTRQAHMAALDNALTDMVLGRPVDVEAILRDTTFVDRPPPDMDVAGLIRYELDRAGATDAVAKLDRIVAEAKARGVPLEDITRNAPAPVRYTDNLRAIVRDAQAQGWDAARVVSEVRNVVERLDARKEQRPKRDDLERGELWVREKLLNAERNGHITPEARRLFEWMLNKNPALADDLAISIRSQDDGSAGANYDPVERLMTLFKGKGADTTAVHELLHHTERMMPASVQRGIRTTWIDELQRLADFAARVQNAELAQAVSDAVAAAAGDMSARARVIEMIQKGKLPYEFYRFTNPSEYWAVNAARIVSDRANAHGWVREAVQWLKELVEKIKEIFGFDNDAAVIRGIEAVLAGDGTMAGRMIGEGTTFDASTNGKIIVDGVERSTTNSQGRPIAGSPEALRAFWRWFGDSKVVDDQGRPMVVYRGMMEEIKNNTFTVRDAGTYGPGIYLSNDPGVAGFWAGRMEEDGIANEFGGSVYPVYVNIKNPANGKLASEIESEFGSGSRDELIKRGYDGIITEDGEIAAFSPEQIKSAIGNRGTFDPASGSILEDITRGKPGVERPGAGVAQKNLNGFEPALRVKVPLGKVKLPEKPLILTGTNKKNAEKQINAIDNILAKFPNADKSPLEWSRMMAYAMATDDVPVPPYRFLADINGDGAFNNLSRLSRGQIDDARHGFENAEAFRQAYVGKELDVETTGKLFMWSFLSRGVSPYTQEGLFIDAFQGIDKWIKKAAEGNFTKADFDAYTAWAGSVAPKGAGQPGAGATHNLNAFGELFLFKMGQKDSDGISLLQHMHNMMEDPNMTGQQIRRWFTANTEGVGIDNKVVSFTLLVAGFKDVMVLDRVQIRQLWDDGRFGDRNLYDGRKYTRVDLPDGTQKKIEILADEDEKAFKARSKAEVAELAEQYGIAPKEINTERLAVAGTALSDITYGARGLLLYEAVERALAKRIESLYTRLGRPEDGSVGRYHWETWVADSQQEASHGTLDAILHAARGDTHMIAEVTAKEGEYGAYQYGARYGRTEGGEPYFRYQVGDGQEYMFSVKGFREFMDAVKLPKNKVVPTKFKVTEAGNAPWYQRPEVNRQRLEELAAEYSVEGSARQGAGTLQAAGRGQEVPDLAGRAGEVAAPSPAGRSDSLADAKLSSPEEQNPTLEIPDADGKVVRATDAIAQADAAVKQADELAQGMPAAIECALRFGGGE